MHAGLLDKVINIEKRSQDQLPSGQMVDTWVRVATLYARIEPLIGREYLAAAQLAEELSHDVTVRYQRYIKPSMRVVYRDKILEIVSAIDPEERREWLYLKCKEAIV
jgi:SPP1 family predicted phage head-tail adaptor